MLTITDLYRSSPSFQSFSRNMFFNHFNAFLTTHNLLYKCQSGFRPNPRSCETILVKITDEWLEAMNKGLFTGVVMIDLRKAHKLLLKKLQIYGLKSNSLKWFESYLSGRYQKVCVDGKLSEPLSIQSGVPQGSILGPGPFPFSEQQHWDLCRRLDPLCICAYLS